MALVTHADIAASMSYRLAIKQVTNDQGVTIAGRRVVGGGDGGVPSYVLLQTGVRTLLDDGAWEGPTLALTWLAPN